MALSWAWPLPLPALSVECSNVHTICRNNNQTAEHSCKLTTRTESKHPNRVNGALNLAQSCSGSYIGHSITCICSESRRWVISPECEFNFLFVSVAVCGLIADLNTNICLLSNRHDFKCESDKQVSLSLTLCGYEIMEQVDSYAIFKSVEGQCPIK